jgi:hypothetical protein
MFRPRFGLAIGLALAACAQGDEGADTAESAVVVEQVMEVVARGLTLEAPSAVPSGWTTIRFTNEAPMVHFVVIEKVPEGQGIASQQAEVAPVFQQGLDLLSAGDVDAAMAKFGELPAWFGEIVFFGGPGLTSPGQVSEATVELEPGTYLLECYVKTGGIFHSYNPAPDVYGMVHEFTVTSEVSERTPPAAAISLEISAEAGITMVGTPSAGPQTFSVRFVDQTVHENFVGHDVHVARLAGGLEVEELELWMDWTRPDGLQTPSPFEFLGGLNEMPAGSTGYFTVTLSPGEYALVSEVPGTRAKGLLRTFRVE